MSDGILGRIQLSGDGTSVVSQTTFADSFVFPLDVTVSSNGTIYVAEFGGNAIAFLEPKEASPVGGVSLEEGLRGLPATSTASMAMWLVAGLLGALLATGSLVAGAAVIARRGG